jgi:hypothetical protein
VCGKVLKERTVFSSLAVNKLRRELQSRYRPQCGVDTGRGGSESAVQYYRSEKRQRPGKARQGKTDSSRTLDIRMRMRMRARIGSHCNSNGSGSGNGNNDRSDWPISYGECELGLGLGLALEAFHLSLVWDRTAWRWKWKCLVTSIS